MAKAKKQNNSLKNILKNFKLKQDSLNTFIGILAVIIFGFIAVNYFTNNNDIELIPPVGNENSDSVNTHIVAEGEDLWSIAQDIYGSGYKWVVIANENNIQDPNLIEVGQVLKLPTVSEEKMEGDVEGVESENTESPTIVEPTSTLTPTPIPQITKTAVSDEVTDDSLHTVARGEGLWQIAEKYFKSGYNWVDIAKENGIKSPYIIYTDQKLVIPEVESKTVTAMEAPVENTISGDIYKVSKGDTLWSIALRAYNDGFKWVDIAKENNIENPSVIEPDQELKLPR